MVIEEHAAGANAERMLQMILGYEITQVVHAVARFSIADRLANAPMTASELAARCGTHPGATFRLLRACASLGLVTADAQLRFAKTPLLETLCKDAPGSLRGLAIAQASPGHWLPWGRFTQAVETGRSQAANALGADIWEYYSKHIDECAAFTAAMTGMTARVSQDVARIIDTREMKIGVDIGGAGGALICALMAENPNLRGIVFDLPEVIANNKVSRQSQAVERLSFECGDFFASVPSADLYLLKYILHDWDNDACERILKHCRQAMRPGARVVVIEQELGELNEPSLAPLVDLTMLVMVTGRERTLREYEKLYATAGLRLERVTSISGGMAVMELVGQ